MSFDEQLEDSNRGTDPRSPANPPPLSHSANKTNSATFCADTQLQNLLGKTDEARPPVPRAGPLEPPGTIDQNVWEPLQFGKCNIGGDIHIHNKSRFSCRHNAAKSALSDNNAVEELSVSTPVSAVGITPPNQLRNDRYGVVGINSRQL